MKYVECKDGDDQGGSQAQPGTLLVSSGAFDRMTQRSSCSPTPGRSSPAFKRSVVKTFLEYYINLTPHFQETGVDPGWINNGGLFIANNKERMEEYRRLYTMGKVLGIESHLLSPEETKVDHN